MKRLCSKSNDQKRLLLSIIWLWIFLQQAAAADPTQGLKFITEDYPPFNYVDNNHLTGISVDL